MGLIYKITNNINNKIYIGQTRNSLGRRWTEHKRDAKKNPDSALIHKAMAKYGIENFSIEIVEDNLTNEELNEREQYWIKKYDSFNNKEKGYNLTSGGQQSTYISDETKEKHRYNALHGITGHTHLPRDQVYTSEVRKRISEGNKGKKVSEETRKKLSAAGKGRKCSEKSRQSLIKRNKERVWSKESKEKLSTSMKNYLSNKENHNFYGKYGGESANHVGVYQYDSEWNFIKYFPSKKDVFNYLGIKGHTQLNNAIKNKTLYKGYYWSVESVETIEITT